MEAKTGPKDVILHLLSMLALYVSVGAFIAIAFQLVNIYIPDTSQPSYFFGDSRAMMRFPLAVLVVVFPLYVWLTYRLQKEVLSDPAKRELRTRKWLLYITLSAAGIIMAGTLVTVIYRYLEGDIALRFLAKVGIILVVTAAVFAYYLWNLKKDVLASTHPRMKWFVYSMVLVVATVLVTGFVNAGTPSQVRRQKMDNERVNALSSLQYQIVEYWRQKKQLPNNLDELKNPFQGYTVPLDPKTLQPYEYRKIDKLKFEICAVFETEAKDSPQDIAYPRSYAQYDGVFDHGIGRTCFERTIDPERERPYEKVPPL